MENQAINQILDILKVMQCDISELKQDVSGLKQDVNGLKQDVKRIDGKLDCVESKLDGVIEQTKNLTEFRTEINQKVDAIREDLSTVEVLTSKNYYDIVRLKAVK